MLHLEKLQQLVASDAFPITQVQKISEQWLLQPILGMKDNYCHYKEGQKIDTKRSNQDYNIKHKSNCHFPRNIKPEKTEDKIVGIATQSPP